MIEKEEKKDIIDLVKVSKILFAKKRIFVIVWGITFVLSCAWIFPQPRYYKASVTLAPEMGGTDASGGIADIASSFGINLGAGSVDALYPTLYPDIFESNDFIASLMTIKVTTTPKDEEKATTLDYYSYLKTRCKGNPYLKPFEALSKSIKNMFSEKKKVAKPMTAKQLDPFKLSKKDFGLFEAAKGNIKCNVDKKTSVISIDVQAQDPLVAATLADSVRQHLQDFIIRYRTKKARVDVDHYQQLTDSANLEYQSAVNEYSMFCDQNNDVILQSVNSERDRLEGEMQLRFTTYQTLSAQLEAMKAKLQERTPAFTILKPTSVPVDPAGPKRMLFVIGMLIMSTIVTAVWVARKDIF